MTIINIALGSFPRKKVLEAMELATSISSEPILGEIGIGHVQLCPQNLGRVDEVLLSKLEELYPETEFRFHANVHLLEKMKFVNLMDEDPEYWIRLKKLNTFIGSPPYSAHPGQRSQGAMKELFGRVLKLQDLIGAPVAIEGMYPSPQSYLVSSSKEYEALLNSGCYFAIDFSHLNIRRTQSRISDSLIKEMISSDRCLEIHVSGNDGSSDQHTFLKDNPWWMELLHKKNEKSIIFSESRKI